MVGDDDDVDDDKDYKDNNKENNNAKDKDNDNNGTCNLLTQCIAELQGCLYNSLGYIGSVKEELHVVFAYVIEEKIVQLFRFLKTKYVTQH